tara:strand:- start:319 stop:438 length:120 start_codon:yes stop_codon:yes gene_type:complete
MNNDVVTGAVIGTATIVVFGLGWTLAGAGAIAVAHKLIN